MTVTTLSACSMAFSNTRKLRNLQEWNLYSLMISWFAWPLILLKQVVNFIASSNYIDLFKNLQLSKFVQFKHHFLLSPNAYVWQFLKSTWINFLQYPIVCFNWRNWLPITGKYSSINRSMKHFNILELLTTIQFGDDRYSCFGFWVCIIHVLTLTCQQTFSPPRFLVLTDPKIYPELVFATFALFNFGRK